MNDAPAYGADRGVPGAGDDDGSAFATLADGLAARGWASVPGFLSPRVVAALAATVGELAATGGLRAAAVGAGAARAVRPEIRGDEIRWLEAPADDAERAACARLDALRVALNARLYLGLDGLECHYARYPAGAGYARHLDRSPAGVERVVSVVAYLNPGWEPADGGELRLHLRDGTVDLPPHGGTLAVFLSGEVEHEVRPAQRARLALTGWFRRRALPAA